jgi:N utilization substance protein A
VGAKGSRVRIVVNELRGEKIDVVQWTEDINKFVANALAPAKVKEVHVDQSTGTATVVVPDYQLSLAIGKEGQNARLAAKLTGCRIDIKSETQAAEDERRRREPQPEPAPEEAPSAEPEASTEDTAAVVEVPEAQTEATAAESEPEPAAESVTEPAAESVTEPAAESEASTPA